MVLLESFVELNDLRCHHPDHPPEMPVASFGDLPSPIEKVMGVKSNFLAFAFSKIPLTSMPIDSLHTSIESSVRFQDQAPVTFSPGDPPLTNLLPR